QEASVPSAAAAGRLHHALQIASGRRRHACSVVLHTVVATLGKLRRSPRMPMPLAKPQHRSIAVAIVLASSLAACATTNRGKSEAAPLGEVFGAEDTYSRSYPASPVVACEAARRALLGQGYVISKMAPEALE